MGSRGPAPTPTAILAARGNPHAKSRAKVEPQQETAAPDCPAWLTGEARDEWNRIAPQLLTRGTLTTADRGMLAGMCNWWGVFVEMRARVSKMGTKPFKGQPIEHPRILLSQAWKEYAKAAQQFGLSPASKSRVVAAPEKSPARKVDEGHTLKIAQ